MIDIERKKQQAINDFYETHCEAPHEIDLLFGFDRGYSVGLAERDRLRSALKAISVWAMHDALDNDHVGRLCDRALGLDDKGEPR